MILFKRMLSGAKQSLTISPAKYSCLLVALAALVVVMLPGSLMAKDTGKTDQWQFMIEPYLWAPGINTTAANGTDVSIDIDDVLSDLEFAAMGLVGVQKGKWSFMIDIFYADLKDTSDGSIRTSIRTIDLNAEVGLKSWIVTPVVGYNLINYEKSKLDIVAGARYLKIDLDASLNSNITGARNPEVSGSDQYWDGIVGLKGEIALYEQLYLPLYLDIGTGNSDFTWQVDAGLGYRFALCDVVAGYRYMSWNFKDDNYLKDLNLSGPYMGLNSYFDSGPFQHRQGSDPAAGPDSKTKLPSPPAGWMLLSLVSCASVTPPPSGALSTMASYQEGVPGGAFVNTLTVSARVTAIDKIKRKATLMGIDGRAFTVKAGPKLKPCRSPPESLHWVRITL